MKKGKRYTAASKNFVVKKRYDSSEAVAVVKKNATAKFDESFEIAINLGVDPKKADQMVRGTVSLPHGTGKNVRVLVLAKSPKDIEAKEAGADYYGLDEYVEKIKGGWTDVDVIIATPDVMGKVGPLGRILGPRGLMPNPKIGTVTFDVAKTVQEMKAGKIEYRVDKTGNVQAAIGKCSFTKEQLEDNVNMFYTSIVKARPQTSKGRYVKKVVFSSTMGPGVWINESSIHVEK